MYSLQLHIHQTCAPGPGTAWDPNPTRNNGGRDPITIGPLNLTYIISHILTAFPDIVTKKARSHVGPFVKGTHEYKAFTHWINTLAPDTIGPIGLN